MANAVRLRGAVLIPPLIYLVLVILATFPFVLDPHQTLTAPLGGDVAGSVSKFQTLVREGGNPFVVTHLVTIGYPDGVTLQPGVDRVAFLNTGFLWGLSLLFGAVSAHGLMTLLGFWLTATIMFLFVRRVTGSIGAGLVAGMAYGFWPHMYLIAAAAPTYTHMWMYILPVWAWLELALDPNRGRALLAGLAPVPAIFWTPYYLLHVVVIVGACFLVVAARAFATRQVGLRAIGLAAIALMIPALAVGGSELILALSGHTGVPIRAVEDAFQESAHPLMYLVPGHDSIWGGKPYRFLVRAVPRAQNANLYVGLSALILAIVGTAAAVREIVRRRALALSSPAVLATLLGLAVVIACFVFSLPPRLAHNGPPMPDALVVAVQPAFRAGQRFVMPLMGGLAILAGLGSSLVLRRISSPRLAPVVAVLLALVVGLDLFARPTDGLAGKPEGVATIPQSSALAALAKQPPGPTFQVVDRTAASPIHGVVPCLIQPQHGKVVIETCGLGPWTLDYLRWSNSRSCDSFVDMRNHGVRYVIVDAAVAALTACDQGNLAGSVARVAADDLFVIYGLG
ncbi:MAG: hypothetical protein M3077_10425 [Candidatus Dormibacteraeota bacterium]|nr:hypothetical protein [Candidatus Dormibacteraeota bacterium]